MRRLWLGDTEDPRWARPALLALLAVTAVLYLWNITSSGYANEFYAASVKSATQSWTALLWASLDSGLSITVDKPPAAIWVMGLSGRLFGFSSASMLVPEALMGVATVGLVYGAVRRLAGHGAGLFAGCLVALSPVAALMFRFNNPDALLTVCMAGAAYAVIRAMQSRLGRRALGWMVLAGWLIGLAFLTKMLQGLLVLPALGLIYLVAAQRPLLTRLGHLLAGAAAMVVSGGWLIALCAVWPASSRPYIGGSSNNSLWDLALGYNGVGRILGGAGNGGGGGGGGGFGGSSGILRLFNSEFASEISWFLPAATLLLIAGLVFRWRAPRTDALRASLILWGTWTLVTAAVFSFMSGTIHPYYSVALVPGIAGTIATGAKATLDRVAPGPVGLAARGVISLSIAATAIWGYVLLAVYAGTWLPALKWVALIGGIGGALLWFLLGLTRPSNWAKKVAVAALLVGTLASVAPATGWTVATIAQGHNGSTPTSGPAAASGMGSRGGQAPSGQAPSGQAPDGQAAGSQTPPDATGQGQMPSGGGMGQGGPGGESSTSAELVSLLNGAGTKWSAAVVGAHSAAGLVLNTDTAVYCIGGFTGSDNNVTLDQFKALVASGQIHYFIMDAQGGQGGGPGGGSGSASAISSWVSSTFTSTSVGNQTVYDLTATK